MRLTRFTFISIAVVAIGAPAAQAQDDDVEITIEAEPADIEIEATPSAEPPPAPAPEPALSVDEAAQLREELARLRARIEDLETNGASAEDEGDEEPALRPPPVASRENTDRTADSLDGGTFVWAPDNTDFELRLSGYVQLQYQHDDLSRDELLPGGAQLNQDGFVVRRGRLRALASWRFVSGGIEIDASTTRGPFVGIQRAFLSARVPFEGEGPPLVALTAGLITLPFGYEVRVPNDVRYFMERTTASLAFFRGPVDAGVRLHGALGPFEYDVGVFNGTPLDDRAGAPGLDPTRAPDVVGRLGVFGDAGDDVRFGGGASFVYGTGFHPGEEAGKSHVEWQDLNENSRIDTGELIPVAARGATPSQTFERWAVGADARLEFRTPAGWTRVWTEAVLASNLDRSFFVADPITQGEDLRELAFAAAFTQQITNYGFVGFRYDLYDPYADWLDTQRGRRVPRDATIHTLSPLVGLEWPGVGRIAFQYDVVFDALARDERGVPTDLSNDRWTVRVQGSF